MPRNPIAIWLETVFFVASVCTAVGWFPKPTIFVQVSPWQSQAILWCIGVGCLISLVGIFWRDRLDGGVIEQLGAVIAGVGLLLFVYVLFQSLPMSAFGCVIYSGLTICFVIQFVIIYRFRKSLRVEAESDG